MPSGHLMHSKWFGSLVSQSESLTQGPQANSESIIWESESLFTEKSN